MDSPILNSFLLDTFQMTNPSSIEVDWFYLDGDDVRRFVCRGSEGWTEITRSIGGDKSPDTHVFTDFEAAEAVHAGYKNICVDGLRMHPVRTWSHSCIEFKSFSDNEWDCLKSVEEEQAAFNDDFDAEIPRIKHVRIWQLMRSNAGLQLHISRKGEIGESSVSRERGSGAKFLGWMKDKLTRKVE